MTHENREKLCLLRVFPALDSLTGVPGVAFAMQYLTHYATSSKVMGSVPDEVIEVFN
jgi:hypothetical protein